MAPKKGKKKGKIGDDWDEEPTADDVASIATTTSTDPTAENKKAPKKKAKGKKGKGKGGDWGSDDDEDAKPRNQEDSDEVFRGAKQTAKSKPKSKSAAAAFALLQVWPLFSCRAVHPPLPQVREQMPFQGTHSF